MIKKIVFNIAVVFLAVFVLDFVIGGTLRNFYFRETSGSFFRGTYSMEITKADILVFGASTAVSNYVPEVFENSLGVTFYNTGQNGLGIFFQLATLKSVLKRYTPKLIILSCGESFSKDKESYDKLAYLLPYYSKHKEIRKIVELKSPFERIKLISEIYPFNSQIFTILVRSIEIAKINDSSKKGYDASYKRWAHKIDTVNTYTTYAEDQNKVMALREFITQAKESGANIFVVYPPVFQKFNMRQEIEIYNRICLIEKVPFWDFSRDTSFSNNKSLFADVDHLNHNGAMLFSGLVAAKIKQAINKDGP